MTLVLELNPLATWDLIQAFKSPAANSFHPGCCCGILGPGKCPLRSWQLMQGLECVPQGSRMSVWFSKLGGLTKAAQMNTWSCYQESPSELTFHIQTGFLLKTGLSIPREASKRTPSSQAPFLTCLRNFLRNSGGTACFLLTGTRARHRTKEDRGDPWEPGIRKSLVYILVDVLCDPGQVVSLSETHQFHGEIDCSSNPSINCNEVINGRASHSCPRCVCFSQRLRPVMAPHRP